MKNETSQKEAPIISIITPSYNQGEFLEETIESVISQKGDFYIDYVIMDGGSTDNSVEIFKKYEKLLNEEKWLIACRGIKYRWISEKDDGQADAIEKGFKLTDGDIGVWLNSDDTFFSDTVFQTVSDYFMEEEVDLVVGNGITMDRGGQKAGDYITDRINIRELIFLDYHILQNAAFLKVSYLKDNPFEKDLNYTFDVDFFIRLLQKGIRYKKIPEKLACFRLYDECKTMSGMKNLVDEYMIIAKKASSNKLLLLISRLCKWITIMRQTRFRNSSTYRIAYTSIRNFCYFFVIGTWGRK